jgi:hypothetical protein
MLELALTWAYDGDATLIALRRDGGAPVFVGMGRSTYALGEAHDPPGAADVAIELHRERLQGCVRGANVAAAPLGDSHQLAVAWAELAARCRQAPCVGTVTIAIDADVAAGVLVDVLDAGRRAGFERTLIAAGLGCPGTQSDPATP